MPKRIVTEQLTKEQQDRAVEWQNFRKEFLFTQRRLAEVLGVSRRTVQMIESGLITPHPGTLRAFVLLKSKHEAERA